MTTTTASTSAAMDLTAHETMIRVFLSDDQSAILTIEEAESFIAQLRSATNDAKEVGKLLCS